jgi:hypothetical protein
VERFHFPIRKLGKPWMVQLATGAKRKISEMIKVCLMNLNGLNTSAELNIIPLGSYDCLIGMDWLDWHHIFLVLYKKAFNSLDEEGNLRTIQGIPRLVIVRKVSSLQLKKSYRKGRRIFLVQMEETPRDKVSYIEYYAVLKEFEYVFKEIPGFPSKRDIDFSINMIPRETLVSKNPYRMSTPELKELQIQHEGLLKKGYICPSVSPWGAQ